MYYSYRKFFQDGISINYFRVEPVNRAEGEAKVKKSKNVKTIYEDEVRVEVIKSGDKLVINFIWKLCNEALKSCIASEGFMTILIVAKN